MKGLLVCKQNSCANYFYQDDFIKQKINVTKTTSPNNILKLDGKEQN